MNSEITKIRKGFFLIIAAALLTVISFGEKSMAQEARIADCVVVNSREYLHAYFTVKNAFTPEMETGLHNGIPITFSFSVELLRATKGLPDKKIQTLSFDHTMNYDTLKEEYHVMMEEQGKGKIVTSRLEEAKRVMAEVNGVELFPMAELRVDTEYVLRVRATMTKRFLPSYFRYLLPWMHHWDFKTDWNVIRFRY